MKDALRAALKGSRADYTEIRLEERETTRVAFRSPEIEIVGGVRDRGGIVRCLVKGGGWGMATFNDESDLPRRVEQAYEAARSISGEPISLADVPVSKDRMTFPLATDFRDIPLAQKVELARGYNEIALQHHPSIVDTTAGYSDSFTRLTFANSEGTFLEWERPLVNFSVSARAREGDNVQSAHKGVSKVAGYDAVLGHEDLVREVAQRAVDLLDAPRVRGGQYTVVCNPVLAGVFVHEAFGHLSESDFIYANPQAQEMMVLGRRFGESILNITDDGSILGLRGSLGYDDEGTPAGRSELVKEGVLVGRLHSRETAAKMGERPTGNARATDYRWSPIVRMTNTFIENGSTPFDDMIADVELGIYACEAYGGQTALESFSFTSGYAYMIRNGKIAEMVRDVALAGNLFKTLASIDAVGNDFSWSDTGMCGKGQGGGLPVAIGAPHIRIRDVVVGGD